MAGQGDWSTSTRTYRLPEDWPAIRRRILARDKWCRGCFVALSAQVDHVIPGDDHSDTNLVGLCRPCHDAKSKREAAEGRRRQAAAGRYPHEQHPGVR